MDENGFLNVLLTTAMPKKLQNNSLTLRECVCVFEHVSVSVCVCVREREREREGRFFFVFLERHFKR
jgi:hypothetical protein